MTGNPVYLISTKGARWVWPVNRECLLLHVTWSSVSARFLHRIIPLKWLGHTDFVGCSVTWSWHINVDCRLFRLPDLDILHLNFGWFLFSDIEIGNTNGVTGQQKMLTPPWHLILPSYLSGVRIALHSILYLPFGLWLRLTLLISLFCMLQGFPQSSAYFMVVTYMEI
jgi:hypothetical protein